jgi:hypothetical protein
MNREERYIFNSQILAQVSEVIRKENILDKNTFYDIKNNTKKYAYGVDPEIVKEDSRERNDPSTGNAGCCWQYGCGTYALNCNCFCDPICIFFDDCCEDVATYCQEETQDSSETIHKKLLE